MKYYTSPTCEHCVSYDGNKNRCKERSSDYFGGDISPFHLACNKYISAFKVFAPVKKKKWHKMKTMEDMDIPGARLF